MKSGYFFPRKVNNQPEMTRLMINNTYQQQLINFGKNVVGYS